MKHNRIAIVGNNDLAYNLFINLTSTIDGVEFFNSKNNTVNKFYDYIIYSIENNITKNQYFEILNLNKYTNKVILISNYDKSIIFNKLDSKLIKELNNQLAIVKINNVNKLLLLSQIILNEKFIKPYDINFIYENDKKQIEIDYIKEE